MPNSQPKSHQPKSYQPKSHQPKSHQPKSQEHVTGPVYSARDVRQGDIVLRKPWERGVFIAGLVGAMVLALVLVLVGVELGRAYSDQHASHRPAQVGLIYS